MQSILVAFLLTIILQKKRRHLLPLLFKVLCRICLRLLVFVALLFGKLIGGFFYLLLITLFDFPSWLLSFVVTPTPLSPIVPRRLRKAQQDMPPDWVRFSICNTDYISIFDLEADKEPGFEWEQRKIHKVSRREIMHRVLPWLESLPELDIDDKYLRKDHDIGSGVELGRRLEVLEMSLSEKDLGSEIGSLGLIMKPREIASADV